MPIEPALQALNADTPSSSALLQRCLEQHPKLPDLEQPTPALPLGAPAEEIESLKMSHPRAAAARATAWLEQASQALREEPESEKSAAELCAALSTWGGIERNCGRLAEAALATHHALVLLGPWKQHSLTGFALQRAAYVLADQGAVAAGLEAARAAVELHRNTPGGGHNAGIASIGLGVFLLAYRRDAGGARAALQEALISIPESDPLRVAAASHGVAQAYLLEGKTPDALETLLALESYLPSLPEHVRVRCQWLKAEIAAVDGEYGLSQELYRRLFPRACAGMEPAGPALIALDWSKTLLEAESPPEDYLEINAALEAVEEQLTPAEAAAIGPYRNALAAGGLDVELLDRTAVALKTAANRMTLGMGRSGGAGKPERFRHAA